MSSRSSTSFAYRASQFVLNNHNLIYCNCATPFPTFVESGKLRGVQYCLVCNRLVTQEVLDNLTELAKQRMR